MKRKAISKRIRFSIFNRDGFSCRYCGVQSDESKLVIDHIKPVCEGGTNDETNLITACVSCNQGKAGKPIATQVQNESHRLALHQEFKELKALQEEALLAAHAERELRETIGDTYCEIFGVDSIPPYALGRYVTMVKQHGPKLVFEWMGYASDNITGSRSPLQVLKYIYGIRRKVMAKAGEEPDGQ